MPVPSPLLEKNSTKTTSSSFLWQDVLFRSNNIGIKTLGFATSGFAIINVKDNQYLYKQFECLWYQHRKPWGKGSLQV